MSSKIGLIGVGGHGRSHLNTLREFEIDGTACLAAAADPFFETHEASARTELEDAGCRCYSDYRSMLDRHPDLDLIVIVAPIPLHMEMIRICLQYRSFIYVEKPPVPTLAQLEELILLDQGKRVTVGFQMISMPAVVRIKEWIRQGRLGAIRHIAAGANWPRADLYYQRARWAGKLTLDGEPVLDGPASNALSHILQNIMFFAGDDKSVFAEPQWVTAGFYRARPIESYDLASIRGGFVSGAEFTAVLSHCSTDVVPFSIIVQGDKGNAWIAENGKTFGMNLGIDSHSEGENPAVASSIFYRETLAWVRGERREPVVSLSDCRGYLKTIGGGLTSSGAVHSIPPSDWQISGEGENRVYHVHGLSDAIRNSLEKNLALEELPDLRWTQPGRPIPTDAVDAKALTPDWLPRPRGADVASCGV